MKKISVKTPKLKAAVAVLTACVALTLPACGKDVPADAEITLSPAPTETASAAPADNPIKINIIAELPAAEAVEDKLEVVRNKNDVTTLDYNQALEYFKTEVYPQVPEDLAPEAENGVFEIYRHDKGKGEVYRDVFVLNYSNTDMSRHVNVEGSTQKYTLEEIEQWHGAGYKLSVINGESVYFALNDGSGYYFAQFEHNGVGFRIIMAGLTEDEAIKTVASLI